jgi:hypothetical protein
MMRSLKGFVVAITFFLFFRYFTVVYYAMEFNDFVEQETQKSQVAPQLQRALLNEAQLYFLPIKLDDIHIKEDDDGLIRVKIDYKVPVNLFVFTHHLSFHATGAGLAAR